MTCLIITCEDLVNPPDAISNGYRNHHNHHYILPHRICPFNSPLTPYSFVSFLSITLFTRWIRLPRFSISSRTLLILLKKSLKAFNRKLG